MSYSWGDDSGSSRVSRSSDGYDYKSARKAYDASSSYTPPKSSGSSGSMKSSLGSSDSASRAKDYKSRIGKTDAPVGKNVATTTTHPVVVCIDVTGSMSHWPGIFFEKLPLLGKEVEHYAKDYAISFSVFGDVFSDSYPLQVRDFDTGSALDAHIAALYPEGNGGDDPEDPELAAYYYLNHCNIDKAVKPFFFIITDTDAHEEISAKKIKKFTGDDIQSDKLDSKELLKKLGEKFSVYVLLKGKAYRKYWADIYNEQRVKEVEEPRDIVELIIACIADEMGEIEDFEMRSSKRHADKPDRVSRVMKSVKADAPDTASPADAGKASKTGDKTGDKSGTKSKTMKSKKLV
jgi:hypothetical protein